NGAITGTDGGDSWTLLSSNPTPYWGSVAHQSSIGAGLHQHYFYGATSQLGINTGDSLYAYVYLDPANVPSELMLQWFNGTWEHRAFWGANSIGYGTDGTPGRVYMGPLPASGKWVRLQVTASHVGLDASTLSGMAFSQFN